MNMVSDMTVSTVTQVCTYSVEHDSQEGFDEALMVLGQECPVAMHSVGTHGCLRLERKAIKAVAGDTLSFSEEGYPISYLLQVLNENCWGLRCNDGGDWEVVANDGSSDRRVVGVGDTAIDALRDAVLK